MGVVRTTYIIDENGNDGKFYNNVKRNKNLGEILEDLE